MTSPSAVSGERAELRSAEGPELRGSRPLMSRIPEEEVVVVAVTNWGLLSQKSRSSSIA